MKILVTGNLGYIGTVLTPMLVRLGHKVIGLDANFYEGLQPLPAEYNQIDQHQKDIRKVTPEEVEGCEAVIHLAALSNDPLGEFDPRLTHEINYGGTIRLAEISRAVGVERFIFVASQSMYGVSDNTHELDEDNSEKNPVTEYAKTKWQAEQEIRAMNSPNFSTVSFRPSTVFGASPRLRTDIVFNRMVASAYAKGEVQIRNDGSPWRPVVHVRDVSNVLIAALDAPYSLVGGESFNVGIPNGNFTIRDLAEAAVRAVPGSEIIYTNEEKDPRTYRVSFDKLLTRFEGRFKPEWNLDRGGEELVRFFREVGFTPEHLDGRFTNRLPQLKFLIGKKELNAELYREIAGKSAERK